MEQDMSKQVEASLRTMVQIGQMKSAVTFADRHKVTDEQKRSLGVPVPTPRNRTRQTP